MPLKALSAQFIWIFNAKTWYNCFDSGKNGVNLLKLNFLLFAILLRKTAES